MKTILFLNHKQKQCGVYQYGRRSADILKKAKQFNFVYCEVESRGEYEQFISKNNPEGIIYNYHPLTMGWLGKDILEKTPHIIHYGLHHEGSITVSFKYNLMVDSTYIDNDNNFSIPRPLFENSPKNNEESTIPIISSFGFGFGNKGFGSIVKLINEQFDEAIIRLHIPFAFYGDSEGKSVQNIHPGCYNEIKKEGIQLQISTEFKSDTELLEFLSSSTINVFLYHEMKGRGLSSVIDYALSVDRPIAITKTDMFRHIYHTQPSICIEDKTIPEIIKSGGESLIPYRQMWSNKNFINKYEKIISKTIL